jgi:biopolymer transport protein ExbD
MNNKLFDTPASKEMPELRARLKENIDRFGDKDPVIIRPADNARQERIIDVLNSAAAAGVKNLTFS